MAEPWRQYGLDQGPSRALYDYLCDWMSKHPSDHFELTDFKWKDTHSSGETSSLNTLPEWSMENYQVLNHDNLQDLERFLDAPVPADVSLRVFISEDIAPAPLQMLSHYYQINAWSFNDMFMELGTHREGSYYSNFTGDTRPYVRVQLPSWWQVTDDQLAAAEYVDGTSKRKKPHSYPASKTVSRTSSLIQRELVLIASHFDHCWIAIFLVENIQWPDHPNRDIPGSRSETPRSQQQEVLRFGYEKDTQTYQSLQIWLLEFIERDQMLAMTYMLRYVANTWREIIAGWTDQLELITRLSFLHPSLYLSKELHEMTNTFLHYIRGLHGIIEVSKAIVTDDYLRRENPPIISNDNANHFQRVVTLSEEQIRDLQDLRERSANLIGMIFNTISIQEANNAIRQGQSIKFITVLATFFVPLSLFSSLFGMNVQELGVASGPPVWRFLTVSLLGTFVLLALAWFLRPVFAYVEHRAGSLALPADDHHLGPLTDEAHVRVNVFRRLTSPKPREVIDGEAQSQAVGGLFARLFRRGGNDDVVCEV